VYLTDFTITDYYSQESMSYVQQSGGSH